MPNCPHCNVALVAHIEIPDKPHLFSCTHCGRTFTLDSIDVPWETVESKLGKNNFRDGRRRNVKPDATQKRMF